MPGNLRRDKTDQFGDQNAQPGKQHPEIADSHDGRTQADGNDTARVDETGPCQEKSGRRERPHQDQQRRGSRLEATRPVRPPMFQIRAPPNDLEHKKRQRRVFDEAAVIGLHHAKSNCTGERQGAVFFAIASHFWAMTASAAQTAVSARNTSGPSATPRHPASTKYSRSASVQPPSG